MNWILFFWLNNSGIAKVGVPMPSVLNPSNLTPFNGVTGAVNNPGILRNNQIVSNVICNANAVASD